MMMFIKRQLGYADVLLDSSETEISQEVGQVKPELRQWAPLCSSFRSPLLHVQYVNSHRPAIQELK